MKQKLLVRNEQVKFVDGKSTDGIRCPVCGESYIQVSHTEPFSTNYGFGTRTFFDCEHGCHTQMDLVLIMQFHKGMTYMIWGDRQDVFSGVEEEPKQASATSPSEFDELLEQLLNAPDTPKTVQKINPATLAALVGTGLAASNIPPGEWYTILTTTHKDFNHNKGETK